MVGIHNVHNMFSRINMSTSHIFFNTEKAANWYPNVKSEDLKYTFTLEGVGELFSVKSVVLIVLRFVVILAFWVVQIWCSAYLLSILVLPGVELLNYFKEIIDWKDFVTDWWGCKNIDSVSVLYSQIFDLEIHRGS